MSYSAINALHITFYKKQNNIRIPHFGIKRRKGKDLHLHTEGNPNYDSIYLQIGINTFKISIGATDQILKSNSSKILRVADM